MIDRLIKESRAYNEFKSELTSGKLAHAFLLIGVDKLILNSYVKALTSLIMCKNNACGKCNDCIAIAEDSHVSVNEIDLTGAGAVSRANELIEQVYRTSFENENRVFIIPNGEDVTQLVQNKLLKTYEEPPEGAIIFLLASSDANILSTIKSRAYKLFAPVFTTQQIYDYLVSEGIEKEKAEIASALSSGRFDLASQICNDDLYYEQYNDVFDMLVNLNKSTEIIEYIKKDIFSKENIASSLSFIEAIFRDALLIATKTNLPLLTLNRQKEISAIATRYSAVAISEIIIEIGTARQRLKLNIDSLTVAETFLFKALELRYVYRQE